MTLLYEPRHDSKRPLSTATRDPFTRAFIQTLLWSEDVAFQRGERGRHQLNQAIRNLDPTALREVVEDCLDWKGSFGHLVRGRERQAGHDFCLTRNGHGAGFWDGDWTEDVQIEGKTRDLGDYLTAMSEPYGTLGLDVGDDGRYYSHS